MGMTDLPCIELKMSLAQRSDLSPRSLTKAFMWQNFRWVKKETKMKTKNCFHFPPPPLYFLFSSLFLTASSYDRGLQISIMLKIILRTTHTIFDELLNRSQNKTTCYYIQQKLKNEMKKPDVCLEEKN